jgi:hypothetical protein
MRVYAHFLKRKNQDTMSDLERLIHTARGENHEQLPEGEDLVKMAKTWCVVPRISVRWARW